MGLEAIAVPGTPLTTVAEMWGHILFWAFLLTTLTYVCVGVVCALCVRTVKKGISFLIPLGYLGYSQLVIITSNAISSIIVASIYETSGWTMTSGVAIGWGLGLSCFSMLWNSFISCGSLYTFM